MPSARLPAPPPPPPPLTLVAGDLAHPASHDVRTYWDACALRRLPERLQLYLAALTEEYEPVMLFLNHSCEPNGGSGGNVVLVAMSDIEAVPPSSGPEPPVADPPGGSATTSEIRSRTGRPGLDGAAGRHLPDGTAPERRGPRFPGGSPVTVGGAAQPPARGGPVPNPGRLPGPILEEWDWQRTGACRDADPDLFFPPDSGRGPRRAAREAAAKAVCRRCPVRRRCAAHALATPEPYGIWGGMSEADREPRRR